MLPHVADEPVKSARSHVRHRSLQAHCSCFHVFFECSRFHSPSLPHGIRLSFNHHPLFVFNTEEEARRQSASQSAVSETAVASTTSVTKLERLTRKSGMKRTHAGITFEELFGTSLEFGLCHLSNTCCFFFFAPINLTPADFFK